MTGNIFGRGAALVLLLGLSGCGGETPPPERADASYQNVAINTPGEEGVSCVVQAGGAAYQVNTPGTVKLRRLPQAMTVNCFKGDHLRGTTHVVARYAPREEGATENCLSCEWPSTVTVAMQLNGALMDVPFIRQGP